MPFTHMLLLKFPCLCLGIMVVGAFVAYGVIGLLLVRRFVPSKVKEHNDVADPLIGVLGTIYAVLIAFAVIIVWQQFDSSVANVQAEANNLAHLYRDGEAFSKDFRDKLNPLLREYRSAVIEKEWKTMQLGEMSPDVERIMNNIWDVYTNYKIRNKTEELFFSEALSKLNTFRGLRRQRLMDARKGIEPLLWHVMIIGALIVISFSFIFGAENIEAHLLMVVLLSSLIGLMLFTVMELDYPFTGSIAVSSEPLQRVVLN